jgi:hypothetical protein
MCLLYEDCGEGERDRLDEENVGALRFPFSISSCSSMRGFRQRVDVKAWDMAWHGWERAWTMGMDNGHWHERGHGR